MDDLDALWDTYFKNPTREIRNQLVLIHLKYVDVVLRRYKSVDQDMLYGYAVEGLIRAIERYKPGSGMFRPYAYLCIKGAIKDGWREMDMLPRRAREVMTRYNNTKSALEQEQGRTPSDAEVLKVLDLTDKSRHQTVAAFEFAASMLDPDWTMLGLHDHDPEISPHKVVEQEAIRGILGDLVSGLPERLKVIVTLHYYEGVTMREIGEIYGVTEARICQLNKQAMLMLREQIVADPELQLDTI